MNDLVKKNEINEKKIKLFLLPKDDADSKNAIIEIRAGTGGLEASLFASDLFKMYEKVSNNKKWKLEIINISKSDAGGLKEVIASIKGKNIYSSLKYESGVHRVQRVPDTETQGKHFTSNNNDECFIYWDLDAVPNENGNRWRQAKNPLRVERLGIDE